MRFGVLTTLTPFVTGGAELQAQWLVESLQDHGHQAELVRLPLPIEPPAALLEGAVAARLMRLDAFDRVIALRFPGYLVPHEDKIVWSVHQLRDVYDLWGTRFAAVGDTPEGRYLRRVVTAADRRALSEARRVYTTSEVTARRMREFSGLSPMVLYPPLRSPESYFCEEPGDYVFFPSRIAANKRQDLAVEAMLYVTSDIRLVIAGRPDTAADGSRLSRLVTLRRLRRRVELRTNWVPESVKLELLSRCLGVVFVPFDEDFGYVTVEALLAAKPVITCTDSGGPLELVDDGVSGLVVEPDPRSVAAAIDQLAGDRDGAARMGEQGRARIHDLDLTWNRVVQELTR